MTMVIAGRRGTVALILVTVGIATLPLIVAPYHLQLASTALIGAMFALSLQLLVGATGLVSLGHAAFFGVGAYTVRLFSISGSAPSVFVTLPSAMILSGLAALAVGALALRTKGFYFLMTTLAFGQMLFFLFHDTPLGGGADGVFVARPALSLFGFEYKVARRDLPAVLLLLNLAVLAFIYAVLVALLRTLFGRALLGIGANEHRMRSMGHDTYALKLVAFVVAGAIAGVAGHMWAMTEAFLNPELLGWHRSVEGLLAILLGGIGALHGPILGAFAFTAIGEAAQLLTERQQLAEGLVVLAVVLGLPKGLAGLRLVRAKQAQLAIAQEPAS